MESVDRIHEFYLEEGHDVARDMNNKEIVNLVWALITQYKYDVRGMFRLFYNPDEFDGRDFEQELRDLFGGN